MNEFWSGFLIGAILSLLIGYYWAMFIFHRPVHCEVMGCGAANLMTGACVKCYQATLAERDDARNATRALWLMFSYRQKEEADKGMAEHLRDHCPWLKEDE